jgi:hypothetical protein
MEFQEFNDIVSSIERVDERDRKLYELGFDAINLSDMHNSIISRLMHEIFGEEGWNWIQYYLYEMPLFKDDGKDFFAHREDGSPIYLRNTAELYSFLKEIGSV